MPACRAMRAPRWAGRAEALPNASSKERTTVSTVSAMAAGAVSYSLRGTSKCRAAGAYTSWPPAVPQEPSATGG